MQTRDQADKDMDEVMPLLNHKNNQTSEEEFRRQAGLARQSCQKGRQFLASPDYHAAAKEFSKAVMTFEYILKNNVTQAQLKGEMASLLKQTIRPSYSNLALCYLKLQRWDLVITFTEQIIKDDPSNTKNIYRRGIARKARKLYDEAIADFEKVVTLDGGMEDECARLIKECKTGKKEEKIKQKQLAKTLISNYSEDKPQPQPEPVQKANGPTPQPSPTQRKDSSFGGRLMALLRACCRRFGR